MRKFVLFLAAGVFSMPVIPTAQAQESVLEEIMVTARKRDETLEEAPVSVRAFTAL